MSTYETVAGLSIVILVFGSLGLALLFAFLTKHRFKSHEDLWIALGVGGGLGGLMLIVFLVFRLALPT